MMYLSALLIDVGENPDRPRPGRLWLRNVYRVHQRLCMAFPSATRVTDDAHFLKPFDPNDFALAQVHTTRGKAAGFLFRIDPMPGGGAIILVQSALPPDWDYTFHNAEYLLAAPTQMKSYHPEYTSGDILRFRLRANPTKRVLASREGDALAGKRVQLYREDEQLDWLRRKGEASGFDVLDGRVSAAERQVSRKEGKLLVHHAVLFDGRLRVTDPVAFAQSVAGGIGAGKGFGFGLLSLAPG